MRALKLIAFVVALAAVVFFGTAAADCGSCGHGKHHGKGEGCAAKGSDCPGYDKSAMTTFKAQVVSLDKEECKGCKMMHVDLVVQTKDEKLTVRLGPAWYIDKQGLLEKNDVVEIYASKTKKGDTDFLVAGKIIKGEDVLVLRDKDGLPMWRGWRRGKA